MNRSNILLHSINKLFINNYSLSWLFLNDALGKNHHFKTSWHKITNDRFRRDLTDKGEIEPRETKAQQFGEFKKLA